jgi:hypothetical protein
LLQGALLQLQPPPLSLLLEALLFVERSRVIVLILIVVYGSTPGLGVSTQFCCEQVLVTVVAVYCSVVQSFMLTLTGL